MKATVVLREFREALKKVAETPKYKGGFAIISCVLMEIKEDDFITLRTTNLDIYQKVSVKAFRCQPGRAAVPIEKLSKIVNSAKSEMIEIEVSKTDTGKEKISFRCGTLSFTLSGYPAEDFPPEIKTEFFRRLYFDGAEFLENLKKTLFAVSLNDSRKQLHGVLLRINKELCQIVATNGKILAIVNKKITEGQASEPLPEHETVSAIIPLDTVKKIIKIFTKDTYLRLNIGLKHIFIEGKSVDFVSKVIEGTYPNYQQAIPTGLQTKVEFNRRELLSKITAVSAPFKGTNAFVNIKFCLNSAIFSMEYDNIGKVADAMAINYNSEHLTFLFHPLFLTDPLKNISDEKVTLHMKDPHNQIMLEAGNFQCVVMPARTRD